MPNSDLSSEFSNPNRRLFLLTSGAAGAAGVIAAQTPAHAASKTATVPGTLRVNGKDYRLAVTCSFHGYRPLWAATSFLFSPFRAGQSDALWVVRKLKRKENVWLS
jgi:hypothetical protein